MAVLNKILCLGFMPFLLGAMNNMTHVGFDPNRWEYLQALPYKPSSGYTGNVYYKKYSFYDGELIVCKRVNTIEQLGWGEVKRAPWHNYIAGNETYQLKPDNHGNTMSCMYKNGRNPDYIISTLLLWSPAHQSNARFRTNTDSYLYVNGFDERRLNVKNRQTYEYNFNVGEILNISCINMPGTPGQAKWIIEHNKLETWDKDYSNKWIKIRLDELHYNAYIKCLYEIESYEKDVDPIPAGQITVYFKLCTPTTPGCALPPPMSSLPPLPHTMSPDVTTPVTVNPFSVSNITSAKPVIFTEGPMEASDDNSKLKCQDYLFLTGLPPTEDSPKMSDDGDSIKCTSVLNYTQTPYHLDMVCYFQVAPNPDPKKRKRASIGFSELKLTMKGQNTSVSVISGPDASVKGNYVITNKDDGQKITCSLMRHGQEASSIDILLKYVPPPPTTNYLLTRIDTEIYTKLNRHKRQTTNKKADLHEDAVFLKLHLNESSFSVCEANSKITMTQGSQSFILITSSHSIYEYECIVKTKKILFEEKLLHKTIYKGFNVTKSLAGTWNCSFLAAKTQGKNLPTKMQPQFTREGFTFLTTNCIFNVDVIDRPTPPTTTATTLTTSQKKPTTTINPTTTKIPATTKISTTTINTTPTSTGTPATIPTDTTAFSDRTSEKIDNSTEIKTTAPATKSGDKSDSKYIYTNGKATTTPPSPTTLSPPTSKSISIEDNDGNKEAEASAETLNQDSGSGSVNMNNVWYGIGALAVIVLAVIVLVVGRRTCKQAKLEQKREQNEFDYENLQNDTPERQFPPNLENAYSLPYDSLGRPRAATDNISEISPYAVANYQGTAPSDTYSIPHVEKDLSKLYSKPVPKSLRKELMYSKVLPKNMRKQDTPVKPQEISYAELETAISGRNQFKPVETTYSEVVTGYTNVNDKVNDYKNVVPPNSRYCNANDTEYAEPAYCELAKDTKKMVDRKK